MPMSTTVDQYLVDRYRTGYVSTMCSIHTQGVLVVASIDHKAAAKAIVTDSKLSRCLYNTLGLNVLSMKRFICIESTRGIASGKTYEQMERNIQQRTGAPYHMHSRLCVRRAPHPGDKRRGCKAGSKGARLRGCQAMGCYAGWSDMARLGR